MTLAHFENSRALAVEIAVAAFSLLTALFNAHFVIALSGGIVCVVALVAAALEWRCITISESSVTAPRRMADASPLPTLQRLEIPTDAIERVDVVPPAFFCDRLQLESGGARTVVYFGSRRARDRFLSVLHSVAPRAAISRRGAA